MSDVKRHARIAVRDMKAARNFPDGTCPASRHVAMMAETLAKGKHYAMLTDEPEHCALSLASTVTSLWLLRAERDKLLDQISALQAAASAVRDE